MLIAVNAGTWRRGDGRSRLSGVQQDAQGVDGSTGLGQFRLEPIHVGADKDVAFVWIASKQHSTGRQV